MISREKHYAEGRFKAAISRLTVWSCALIFPLLTLAIERPAGFGARLGSTLQGSTQQESPEVKQDEIAVPLPQGKKLILTDGSFQIVREYHREGDRVRYYSLERSAWEEIPAALVDWAATQKAEADQESRRQELDKQIADSEKKSRFADLDVDTSFEVRPNVFLPDGVGFYALDGNKIAVMQQEQAEIHTEKGRAFERIATGIPISAKQDMEIPGKEAKLRIHTGDVEFYFRTADKRDPHLRLLHAQIKDGKRKIEVIKTNVAGEQTYKDTEVSLLQWDAARGLYRFTVDQPLDAGEYGIIEATPAEGQSLYVWTFGVDLPGVSRGVSKDAATKSSSKK